MGLDLVLKPKAQDNGDTKIKIFMILKLKIQNNFRQICLHFVTVATFYW